MKTLTVDITNRCNLRCKHCYYYKEDYPKKELGDDDWFSLFVERNPELAVFVGGEPMLRKWLLKDLSSLVSRMVVVTNGLFPLDLQNTQFIVSIDGTKKYHDEDRGIGTYDKIKKNITKDCIVAMTINEKNKICIKDFYNEWKDQVKGVRFVFYSPDKVDDPMRVTSKNEIIEQIKTMNTLNPPEELELWKEENMEESRKKCAEKTGAAIRLDCLGKEKKCNNPYCSATYCLLGEVKI